MSTIKDAIEDLLDNPQLEASAAFERHFNPSFRQRVNGTWIDSSEFLMRIAQLREVLKRATVTVLDKFVDGNQYAERHIIDLVMHNGEEILHEVYLFAERDSDGRFNRIEEATLALNR